MTVATIVACGACVVAVGGVAVSPAVATGSFARCGRSDRGYVRSGGIGGAGGQGDLGEGSSEGLFAGGKGGLSSCEQGASGLYRVC
jgi:hypothetical protein